MGFGFMVLEENERTRAQFAKERLIQLSPKIAKASGNGPGQDTGLVNFYTRWVVARFPEQIDATMAATDGASAKLDKLITEGPLAYLALPDDSKAAIRHDIAQQYIAPDESTKPIRKRKKGQKITMFSDMEGFASDPDALQDLLRSIEEEKQARFDALRNKNRITHHPARR